MLKTGSSISLFSWWLPYRPLYRRLWLLCQRIIIIIKDIYIAQVRKGHKCAIRGICWQRDRQTDGRTRSSQQCTPLRGRSDCDSWNYLGCEVCTRMTQMTDRSRLVQCRTPAGWLAEYAPTAVGGRVAVQMCQQHRPGTPRGHTRRTHSLTHSPVVI